MRNQYGQSLVELMVSVVIITVALSGIIAIFPYIVQRNVRIQMQNNAVNLAQNEWERLRALSYYDEELNALDGVDGMVTIKEVENFLIRVTVKYVNPRTSGPPEKYPSDVSEDTGLKEIAVSVKRKDGIGHQVNLVSYFSKARPGKG